MCGQGISPTYHNKHIFLAVVVKIAHQTLYVSKTSASGEVQISVHVVNVIPLGILVIRKKTVNLYFMPLTVSWALAIMLRYL